MAKLTPQEELELLQLEEEEYQASLSATQPPKPQRADPRAEFEAGNPRAKMTDVATGKETYGNPISGPAAFASKALSGAASIPFVGDMAGKAITAATGTDATQWKEFSDQAFEQHPFLASFGEAYGALRLGPKALEGVAAGVVKAAKAAYTGVKEASGAATALGMRVSGDLLQRAGIPFARKFGVILSDAAAKANPKVLRQNVDLADEAMDVLGRKLDDYFKAVEDILVKAEKPTAQAAQRYEVGLAAGEGASSVEGAAKTADSFNRIRSTAGEVKEVIKARILEPYRQAGIEPDKGMLAKLDKALSEHINVDDETVLSARQVWKYAQKIEKLVRKYDKARTFSPAAGTKADMLNEVSVGLRDHLYNHYVKSAAGLTNDKALITNIDEVSKNYGIIASEAHGLRSELKQALSPGKRQEALNLAAQVLSMGPEKLGPKWYKLLLNASYKGLPAVAQLHAKLLNENEEYRDNYVGGSNGSGQ